MPLANIKRRESVPDQSVAKLKRRKQKRVYSIRRSTQTTLVSSFKIYKIKKNLGEMISSFLEAI